MRTLSPSAPFFLSRTPQALSPAVFHGQALPLGSLVAAQKDLNRLPNSSSWRERAHISPGSQRSVAFPNVSAGARAVSVAQALVERLKESLSPPAVKETRGGIQMRDTWMFIIHSFAIVVTRDLFFLLGEGEKRKDKIGTITWPDITCLKDGPPIIYLRK